MTDQNEFQTIAAATNIGHVGIITEDGYPRVVAVNFATIGDRIFFHGAVQGEKFDAFDSGAKVTMSIALPYAMIPSHWQDPDQACRANQFFKSALVRGHGAIVEDDDEKAAALQALMEKHQPEGFFRKIRATESIYRRELDRTGIYRIDPDQVTTRCEMGQRLDPKIKKLLIEKLEERGEPVDLATAEELKRQSESDPQ